MNLRAFTRRFEYRIEAAVINAVDLSIQPPFPTEITQAAFISMTRNVPLPAEALRRRTALFKFLRENPPDPAQELGQETGIQRSGISG